MAESSIGARAGSADGAASDPVPAGGSSFFAIPREPPKVVVKADLLPAVSVLSMVGLLGIPLGWLWSLVAPGLRVRVLGNNRYLPLDLETWHRFDDMAIFALFGLGAGVLVGVVVWLLRERRGPVILLAGVAGALLAAWLAAKIGVAFAQSAYAVTDPPAMGAVLEQAPRLDSNWVLLAYPLTTALSYGMLAAWNGHDDLGRRLG